MKIPPPAGKSIASVRDMDFRGEHFERLVKKKGYFCISTENGWVIAGRGRILAAFYEDRYESLIGLDAFARLMQYRRAAEVFEVDRKLLKIFMEMYPELLVQKPLSEVILEIRSLDAIDSAVGSQYFELAGSAETGTAADAATGTVTTGTVTTGTAAGTAAGTAGAAGAAADDAGSPGDEAADILPEDGWVMNLEEYIYGLEGFTGIVEASDGDLVFTFWLKDGEMIAARMIDRNLTILGNSVLYFSSIPARVVKKPWEDPPPDALCIESDASVKALYTGIERGETV